MLPNHEKRREKKQTPGPSSYSLVSEEQNQQQMKQTAQAKQRKCKAKAAKDALTTMMNEKCNSTRMLAPRHYHCRQFVGNSCKKFFRETLPPESSPSLKSICFLHNALVFLQIVSFRSSLSAKFIWDFRICHWPRSGLQHYFHTFHTKLWDHQIFNEVSAIFAHITWNILHKNISRNWDVPV